MGFKNSHGDTRCFLPYSRLPNGSHDEALFNVFSDFKRKGLNNLQKKRKKLVSRVII